MSSINDQRAKADFPLGAGIKLDELDRDPYPFFAEAREREPVTWVACLNMWFVTRYADVRAILSDTRRFTNASERSPVFDTFGTQMLTTDGMAHDRYREAMRHAFLPGFIRSHLEPAVRVAAERLVEAFATERQVELRGAFASRLPVQTMLLTFGLPLEQEGLIRDWYDRFEPALANFAADPQIRSNGRNAFADFHAHFDGQLRALEGGDGTGGFLEALVSRPANEGLSHDEIIRNLAIIFFGGISTVEALILNCLWALLQHGEDLERVRADLSLVPSAVDEAARWQSPVQSATRHAVRDCELGGVRVSAGDIVGCMLGAANRDPSVFPRPDRFEIGRGNARSHLGFAAGPHHCLGFRLAQAQARIALETVLTRLPAFALADDDCAPVGYEFRQPRSLRLAW